MKPVHQVLAAAVGLLLLGAAVWWLLTLRAPRADWLTVEATTRAGPGETVTLRIRVATPDPGLYLTADLHGWTPHKHPLRSVSDGRPQRLGSSVEPVDFLLRVPVRPDLAKVRAIIFLSPTGHWADRTRVAASDEIPLESAAGSPPAGLGPLRVSEVNPAPAIPRVESGFLRSVIVGLWLVMMAAVARQTRPATPGAAPVRSLRSAARLIALCLAALLVEILGAEQRIGDLARQFAVRHDLYERRQLVQQIAVLLASVSLAAVSAVAIIRARRRRLVCGLLTYAVISATATLSLHETDALLFATILGLPVEQLAKLVTLGVGFWGLRSASAASPPAPPPPSVLASP